MQLTDRKLPDSVVIDEFYYGNGDLDFSLNQYGKTYHYLVPEQGFWDYLQQYESDIYKVRENTVVFECLDDFNPESTLYPEYDKDDFLATIDSREIIEIILNDEPTKYQTKVEQEKFELGTLEVVKHASGSISIRTAQHHSEEVPEHLVPQLVEFITSK